MNCSAQDAAYQICAADVGDNRLHLLGQNLAVIPLRDIHSARHQLAGRPYLSRVRLRPCVCFRALQPRRIVGTVFVQKLQWRVSAGTRTVARDCRASELIVGRVLRINGVSGVIHDCARAARRGCAVESNVWRKRPQRAPNSQRLADTFPNHHSICVHTGSHSVL